MSIKKIMVILRTDHKHWSRSLEEHKSMEAFTREIKKKVILTIFFLKIATYLTFAFVKVALVFSHLLCCIVSTTEYKRKGNCDSLR